MSGESRDFTTFAWQGIQLTVPDNWDMVTTRGEYNSGFVSLADEDRVRLQVKWETDKADSDPADATSRYIRELRKQAKKNSTDIDVNRRLNLASLQGKTIECYDWRSDNRGTGMVSRCDKCDRMVHVVVLAAPDQPIRNLARTIFASLKDHPDSEEILWDFFDLRFRTPASIPLKRSDLKTGCVRMQFRKKSEELEVVRASLAKLLLKDQSLKNWVLDFYESELKRHTYEITHRHIRDHEAIQIEGRPWLVLDPWRIFGKGKSLQIVCWHCTTTNRIFLLGYGSRSEADLLPDVIQSTACCENEDE